MNPFDKDAPLDIALLKYMADSRPAEMALQQFAEVLELWRAQNLAVFMASWDRAFKFYEGALPDAVSHHLAAFQLAFSMCGLPIVNPIPVPEIREVDDEGFGPDGDDYEGMAEPALVERGLAFNVPVLVRYPDRRLVEGNEVRFTGVAVKMLEVDLKASVLPEEPWRVQ